MNPVGIMQGRLLPPFDGRIHGFPVENWRLEFSLARSAGLHCIEWIFEEPGQERNPVSSDSGIAEIKSLSSEHGVKVLFVCANYYMTRRLVSSDGALQEKTMSHFLWLVERIRKLDVRYVVLSFLDSSSLPSEAERKGLLLFLERILPSMENLDMKVHLETDFPPKIFNEVMKRIDHPLVRVNYDIGNSASLGFDPAEELKLLGPRLGSVHVKDRMLGGSMVPLGRVRADFSTCYRLILESGFDRWFILEAARQEGFDEAELAAQNRRFVENCIQSLSLPEGSSSESKEI